MLTIEGRRKNRYCDGIKRRSFLQIGALGLGFGGMTLADVLRLEAAEGITSSTKSIINIQLSGGPSHQDLWDMKPEAPVEFRGEFNPVKTNVPGVEICEHFSELPKMADKFSLVRGLVGGVEGHNLMPQTAYERNSFSAIGGPPAIGSVIAKLQGPNGGVPPFVSFQENPGDTATPGYLGPIYQSFRPESVRSPLELRHLTAGRLNSRIELLKSIDNLRRDVDVSGQMDAADAFTQQAADVLLSGKMAEAIDLSKEDPKVVARYGIKHGERYDPVRGLLMARRLVEVGVRYVSIFWEGWDTHSKNFIFLRKELPALDVGLANLIRDLHERGLGDDVTIAAWGEFGRTPRVANNSAGRHHWPRVSCCFLAGGAVKGGRLAGASDRIASDAEQPVQMQEVVATMYHTVGIDTRTAQIIDPAGRPRYLLDHREPIRQLI